MSSAPYQICVVFVVVLALLSPGRVLAQADLRALADRYQRALDQERWAQVIRYGEQIMEARPELSLVAFNLACAYAQEGDPERAIEWLDRSASNGFGGIVSIQTDPDLDPVREHERFAAIEAIVQATRDERFGAFCEAAREAEMLVVVPEGLEPGEAAPLIVALHGTGGRAENLVEVYRGAASEVGAVLVVPNGLRPSGEGFTWTYRDEAEWMVFHAIERAGAVHPVDASRVVLTGFSMGANTTLEVGLKHPERFVGLIPVCGHWDPDVMVLSQSEDQPRVCLMIGARDPWRRTFTEAHRTFGGAGVESRLRVYQGVGHAYPANAEKELIGALRYVLGSEGVGG